MRSMSVARKTAACLTAEFSSIATTISQPAPLLARTTSLVCAGPSTRTHEPRTGPDHSWPNPFEERARARMQRKRHLFTMTKDNSGQKFRATHNENAAVQIILAPLQGAIS